MQKFVIKKITRSTNITISEEQNLLQCSDQVQQLKPKQQLHLDDQNLENQISVKMCGYLKKKRNFGGWTKLFFVLQNSLLMSYNSKEEYEEKLKSFKDVICLIPGNTVLLPSLEPRFTIASNLNTFYIFRCDDNKTCSKWITAILECLSRDINMEFTGKKSSNLEKNSYSQQSLSNGSGSSNRSKYPKFSNHSWENLQGPSGNGVNSNWIVNHNGRILLELNMLNCNRAKLPIASQTAKILKNCTDNDVIQTTKQINFINNDENHNFIHHNGNHHQHEMNLAHDTHHLFEKPDQFRLHNDRKIQSREVNRISKMFESTTKFSSESESQRPENLTQSNGTVNEIGTEEQEQTISLGEEYSMFTTGDYASVDSTRFNNKLNIEDTYSEIGSNNQDGHHYVINDSVYAIPVKSNKWIKSHENGDLPEYSVVNLHKKYEERLKKGRTREPIRDELKVNDLLKNLNIYEDIEIARNKNHNHNSKTKISDETNIYELIDIPPLNPSTRKARSLVWKNLSRINIFDFAKRFKDNSSNDSSPMASTHVDSETIKKRQKHSLTFNAFSKHFNYRSMRNKARKMYRKSNSTSVIPEIVSASSTTSSSFMSSQRN
ncbi:hypothetical protein ACKWTF_005381 [Chironomus riparius]